MSIRNRTGYSFRSAIGNLELNHKKITEITRGFSPITDTASTFGHTKWTKLCTKAGSKPVFGIELAVTKSINDKKPGFDYWTFIAKNNLRALHELLILATNQFHYVPLLTFEQAIKAEGVFSIAGTKSNYSELPEDIYLPLTPSMNNFQLRKAVEIGRQRLVLMSDNRYIEPGDRDLYQIQLGRDAAVQTYPQHVMTDDELIDNLSERTEPEWVGNAIFNRNEIFAKTTAVQLKSTLLVPEKPKTLRVMCEDGAAILGIDLKDEVYSARLDKELDLISKKNFEDYFYIIADMCQWARARMIVGPARGSSCGSLVCFLLQITTVDPIPYGLIFERFIDINREDLPDIDIDFSATKREMAFKYMEGKYGSEHVARLGTVALLRPRSVLSNTAAALDIPRWKIDKVADSIIKRSGGDARALQATEDTLKDTQVGRDLLAEYPEMLEGIRMEGNQPITANTQRALLSLTDQSLTM